MICAVGLGVLWGDYCQPPRPVCFSADKQRTRTIIDHSRLRNGFPTSRVVTLALIRHSSVLDTFRGEYPDSNAGVGAA